MKILFLGYDARYEVLIKFFTEKHQVDKVGYKDNLKLSDINIKDYQVVIVPMCGVKEGYIKDLYIGNLLTDYEGIIFTGLKNNLQTKGSVISFLDDVEIQRKNNDLTVLGIIDKIKDVSKRQICILGGGKIGSLLYSKLKSQYNVLVGVLDKDINLFEGGFKTSDNTILNKILESSTLIINTVPKHILTCDNLSHIKKSTYFLDIASYPYAIDKKNVTNYDFTYYLYSSIPSRYDKEKAGKILLKKFKEANI